MSARSYATTARDLALSLMVTPRKSPLLEAIDAALDGCNLIQSRTADLQNACLGEASS